MGPGGGRGHAQPVIEFGEFSDRMGGADASAGEDHGSLCISYAVENFTTIGIQPGSIAGDLFLWGLVLRGIITANSGGIGWSGPSVDRNIKPQKTTPATLCEGPS